MKIPAFQLERFFAQYEFKCKYLLCASDCESLTIQELLDFEPEAETNFKKLWLGYTESQGNPELREAISQNLYENTAPENILVHAGAEEAIFNFMNAALSPGDHLIVHYPCYQSLFQIAEAAGCQITRWEADQTANWELDLNFLKTAIQPNTRAIVINHPHNPTGYLMQREKFAALIEIARAHNLLLFSDEVYRGLEYNPADRLPAACDQYENAVSLGVMSKTYGLPGLRIGWAATRNRQVFEAMAAFKDYTSICNSAPSEFLATLALRHHEKLVERNLQIIHQNLALLNPFFEQHADLFDWQAPRAGAIAFPALKLAATSIEDFSLQLLDQTGVLLLPGNYYGYGEKNFRIGFGRRNLSAGIEQFNQFLQHNFRAAK